MTRPHYCALNCITIEFGIFALYAVMHKTILHMHAHKSKMTVICRVRYDCYNLQSNKGWQLIRTEQSSLTNHDAVSVGDKEELQPFPLHEHASATSPCVMQVSCVHKVVKEILL